MSSLRRLRSSTACIDETRNSTVAEKPRVGSYDRLPKSENVSSSISSSIQFSVSMSRFEHIHNTKTKIRQRGHFKSIKMSLNDLEVITSCHHDHAAISECFDYG